MSMSRWLWGLLITLGIGAGAIATPALADNPAATIPPGTVITMQNWQQYKQFFTEGVQGFFEGKWFWKMPSDLEIHVAATHVYPLPKPFIEANEKYGGQARLVKQSDGRWKLENYVAGFPFPDPSGPNKALEIAANVTYRIQGYM
ncbi:MAG: DUF1329 domain-containing protein, partial [Candidatus Binataceae bacterium]